MRKKPKLWNIAILSILTLAAVIPLYMFGGQHGTLAINLILSLYFALVILLLLRALSGQLKYNMYSYNTIYYIGFSIFLLSVLITQTALTYMTITNPGMYSNDRIIHMLLSSARSYVIISVPFILLFSAALSISNVALIKHEGKSLFNLLGVILSLLMLAGAAVICLGGRDFTGSTESVLRQKLIFHIFSSVYLYCECMLVGAIVSNAIVSLHEPRPDKDFVIILGCGINDDGTPTPLLRGRLDTAFKFCLNQIRDTGKIPYFITSGGQGPDEIISESLSMKNYLIKQGVDEDKIIEEDQSKSTHENMEFSKKKISEAGYDPASAKVAYTTSNYHVFRSGIIAKRAKLNAEGIGARTKWYFWPNAAVREFAGLMSEHRGKQILILGGIITIYTLLTLISI